MKSSHATIVTAVKEHRDRHEAAWQRGRKFGLRIRRITDTDYQSAVCAGMLAALATKDDELTQLRLEWTFEKYWAVQLEPLLPSFEKAWKALCESGPLEWGDADYTAQAETSKSEKMVVSLECHCSCANDNIHLFIYEPSKYGFGKFHVRTVGRRASKTWGNSFKSLAAMRRNNFELAYGDCRDEGYALTYEEFTRKVDRGYSMGSEVYWAIWHLRGLVNEVSSGASK